jgi:hypothetical protein
MFTLATSPSANLLDTVAWRGLDLPDHTSALYPAGSDMAASICLEEIKGEPSFIQASADMSSGAAFPLFIPATTIQT